jgi:hypothetical protein
MRHESDDRLAAVEAKLEARIQELETLVNLALRLLALEKPLSTLLKRYGASEAEERAVHALLDDVVQRIGAGGIYTPAFAGFVSDLGKRFPAIRGDREFVSLLLDTLKIERPAYQRLHTFAFTAGWPQWQ